MRGVWARRVADAGTPSPSATSLSARRGGEHTRYHWNALLRPRGHRGGVGSYRCCLPTRRDAGAAELPLHLNTKPMKIAPLPFGRPGRLLDTLAGAECNT